MQKSLVVFLLLSLVGRMCPAAPTPFGEGPASSPGRYSAVLLTEESPERSSVWLTNLGDDGPVAGGVNQGGPDYGSHGVVVQNGVTRDVGTLGYRNSVIDDTNRWGDAAGFLFQSVSNHGDLVDQRAFVWHAGVLRALPTEDGWWSCALSINDNGTIAGITWKPDHEAHAVLWDREGRRELGMWNDRGSRAFRVNNRGTVAGMCYTAAGDYHLAVWKDGRMLDGGSLGGQMVFTTGLNEHDEAVGYARLPDGKDHAFVWRGGTLEDLGTLGGASSMANDISDAGWIVGRAEASDGKERAALWVDGRIHDLNALVRQPPGWRLEGTIAINRRGQILAWAVREDEEFRRRQYLLVPASAPLEAADAVRIAGGLEHAPPGTTPPLDLAAVVRLMRSSAGLDAPIAP